jgi:hypothetical protein
MQTPKIPNDLPEGSERLRRALEASTEHLDAASLSRLKRARQAALEAARPVRRRPWALPVGLAFAASFAVAALLLPGLLPSPTATAPALPVVDPEFALLGEDVEPALLEDLEFYAWLDSQQGEDTWEG